MRLSWLFLYSQSGVHDIVEQCLSIIESDRTKEAEREAKEVGVLLTQSC